MAAREPGAVVRARADTAAAGLLYLKHPLARVLLVFSLVALESLQLEV